MTTRSCDISTSVLETSIGPISLAGGLPATTRDAEILFDAADFQRACQAYLWGLPLVSFAQWQHSARTVFGMRDIDMVVYESLSDRLGLLTGDPATTYAAGLPDLMRTGALIIEYPSGSSSGAITDFWQRPITYLGESGPDGGMGGRYLVVGPGQKPLANVSDFVIESPTINVFVGFRALDVDPARANALVDRYCMYSYGAPSSFGPTSFLRPRGRAWSQVPPRGLSYWERLAAALRREANPDRDAVMLSMLEPLGITLTHPFAPTMRQRRLLEDAEQVGALMAQANAFHGRGAGRYRPTASWREILPPDQVPSEPARSAFDERAAFYYKASATSAGPLSHTSRRNQGCLGVYHDADGHALDGGRAYRLRVPPDPPARSFWSLAVYDAAERCLINNGRDLADRSSQDDMQRNADGSIDIFVGPTPPGGREQNWIATVPGRSWFAYFRLYEPLEPYFARQFALPDFEPLTGRI